jgi:NAD(P)-dependent dehydrogenase (short-subunit alcohol dehydrogenase family)
VELRDRVAVVTGGAAGIGAAMCRRFAAEGARLVVVADRDADGASRVADAVEGLAAGVDVTKAHEIEALVDRVERDHGPIDLFCSNAGIASLGGVGAPDELWRQTWEVNVMSHVYAARAVLPSMLARGAGYLLNTASAAGLLTNIGAAAYSVTKHGAVALAEWLSVTYGERGIKVSCLCPQFVRTGLLDDLAADAPTRAWVEGAALSPDEVADAVVAGLAREEFLILPHREVADYFRTKAADYERWLSGMRRLQAKVLPNPPEPSA